MLKAQLRCRLPDFRELIDRAVDSDSRLRGAGPEQDGAAGPAAGTLAVKRRPSAKWTNSIRRLEVGAQLEVGERPVNHWGLARGHGGDAGANLTGSSTPS
jgi:hypothetical protein